MKTITPTLRLSALALLFHLTMTPSSAQQSPGTWLFSGFAVEVGGDHSYHEFDIANGRWLQRQSNRRLSLNGGVRLDMKSGGFAELGIASLYFKESDELVQDTSIGIAFPVRGTYEKNLGMVLRIHYGHWISQNPDARWRLALGLSLNPYVDHYRQTPKTSASIPYRALTIGSTFQIGPQLFYALSDKVGIGFSTPFQLADLSYRHAKAENPLLTENQQSSGTTSLEMGLQEIQLQVGLYARIN